MVLKYQPGKLLQWNSVRSAAFHKCKEAIANCPTLAFLYLHAPIVLETDAPDYGVGAYLYQIIDLKQVPGAFSSKTLNAVQQR